MIISVFNCSRNIGLVLLDQHQQTLFTDQSRTIAHVALWIQRKTPSYMSAADGERGACVCVGGDDWQQHL